MNNRSIDFFSCQQFFDVIFFIFLKVEPNDEHMLAPCRRTFLCILNSAYPTNAITIQNFPARKCGDGDVPCERPVHFRIVACVFITFVVGRIFDRECLNCWKKCEKKKKVISWRVQSLSVYVCFYKRQAALLQISARRVHGRLCHSTVVVSPSQREIKKWLTAILNKRVNIKRKTFRKWLRLFAQLIDAILASSRERRY